ncbi:MAG: hypothetical protein H8M99_10755 [Gloeobacteraceae cyanobacterium ES-bin-144]|nr:hypothetical protein [Verrucomicrobiales bacterium]
MRAPTHETSFAGLRPIRKARSHKRGTLLIEAMLSLTLLTVLAVLMLQLSLNIVQPRQWTILQTLTDAYMTYERSYAERIPFENLLASDSPWPTYPTMTSTSVELGRLPGNRAVMGTVVRTRIPDPGNYPIDGGSGDVASNPAAMKVWRVQSIVTYTIGTRTYAKSRTVLRSQ